MMDVYMQGRIQGSGSLPPHFGRPQNFLKRGKSCIRPCSYGFLLLPFYSYNQYIYIYIYVYWYVASNCLILQSQRVACHPSRPSSRGSWAAWRQFPTRGPGRSASSTLTTTTVGAQCLPDTGCSPQPTACESPLISLHL